MRNLKTLSKIEFIKNIRKSVRFSCQKYIYFLLFQNWIFIIFFLFHLTYWLSGPTCNHCLRLKYLMMRWLGLIDRKFASHCCVRFTYSYQLRKINTTKEQSHISRIKRWKCSSNRVTRLNMRIIIIRKGLQKII